ncbi:MAG TPA: TGS domain-containing protein, partial [Gemmatimonadales bacterium]|nr:TGS domain-containing protein [Gemmatimonadales bacterium]
DGATALEGLDEVHALLKAQHLVLQPVGRARLGPDPDARFEADALIVMTGLDKPGVPESIDAIDELLERRWPILAVSPVTGEGLDLLRRRTFEAFNIIRVYTKEPGKPADRSAPFTLPRESTVADLAARIHKDLASSMKFARVWGPSAFEGATVHKDHVLAEGDVVEIHT